MRGAEENACRNFSFASQRKLSLDSFAGNRANKDLVIFVFTAMPRNSLLMVSAELSSTKSHVYIDEWERGEPIFSSTERGDWQSRFPIILIYLEILSIISSLMFHRPSSLIEFSPISLITAGIILFFVKIKDIVLVGNFSSLIIFMREISTRQYKS